MELQVRIEPLVVLGEPLIIDGWVFGVLVPAGPDESFAVQYKKSIVVRRMIRNSREFLLGYINVVDNQSARPSTYEKQLCSVVKKYGVIGHCFTMPPSLPTRCVDRWRRAEKAKQVPFALNVRHVLSSIRQVAAYWDLVHALSTGDADTITAAQVRRGHVDSTSREYPELGFVAVAQLVSSTLRSAMVRLSRDDNGSFIMTAESESLETALLLALCDNIAVTYRRCKTCARWFAPKGEKVHCTKRCRTRASVYKLRAVRAVRAGTSVEDAAKQYSVPPDEIRAKIGPDRRKGVRAK
jgi:hypothetical protein